MHDLGGPSKLRCWQGIVGKPFDLYVNHSDLGIDPHLNLEVSQSNMDISIVTYLTIFLVRGNLTPVLVPDSSSRVSWNCLVLSRLHCASGTVAVLMMLIRGGLTLCREPISSYNCTTLVSGHHRRSDSTKYL